MDSFQKNVGIAIGILIILILGFVYWMMSKASKSATWPPFTSPCPDYWIQDGSGICQNPMGLGSFSSNPFSATYDPSNQSPCCNYLFATQNQLAWDGLTYGVNPNPETPLCPASPVCNSTSSTSS